MKGHLGVYLSTRNFDLVNLVSFIDRGNLVSAVSLAEGKSFRSRTKDVLLVDIRGEKRVLKRSFGRDPCIKVVGKHLLSIECQIGMKRS